MDNIVGRLQSLFPPHQLDVIIGSLLGDARLECRSAGIRHPITARFRVHHGERQRAYVFWKYGILKNFVSQKPREIIWDNPKRNLRETSWYFHTRSSQAFGIIHGYFYHNGLKTLPEHIGQFINPKALAIWFMDDGSNNGNNCTISTHSFSLEEQKRISRIFKEKFEITARMVKDRTKFKIALGVREYQKFIRIIQPHIASSMNYKIVNPRNDFAEKQQELENAMLLFSN